MGHPWLVDGTCTVIGCETLLMLVFDCSCKHALALQTHAPISPKAPPRTCPWERIHVVTNKSTPACTPTHLPTPGQPASQPVRPPTQPASHPPTQPLTCQPPSPACHPLIPTHLAPPTHPPRQPASQPASQPSSQPACVPQAGAAGGVCAAPALLGGVGAALWPRPLEMQGARERGGDPRPGQGMA